MDVRAQRQFYGLIPAGLSSPWETRQTRQESHDLRFLLTTEISNCYQGTLAQNHDLARATPRSIHQTADREAYPLRQEHKSVDRLCASVLRTR